MRRFIYNFLMFSAVLAAISSCSAPVDVLKTIPTKDSYTTGDYDWCVRIADEDCYVTAIATDCDTLFNAAATVTLELRESVDLPENMAAEFKDIELYLFGTDKIDDMKPTTDGYEAIKKFLKGGEGKEIEITFVSEAKLSKSEIVSEVKSVDSFRVSGLDFTVDGKVHQKELFKYLFDGADINSVIEDFEELVDDLKIALNAYVDDESNASYEQLEQVYYEAEVFINKLELSLDEDEITRSQYNRLSDAYEIVEEAYDEI